MQAVLLCGAPNEGLGALGQIYHVPALPIANTPLLLYSVALLQDGGITALTINTFYGAEQVAGIVQAMPRHRHAVKLIFERRMSGSATLLHELHPRPSTPFIVMMGDIFFEQLDIPALVEAHAASGAIATVVACRRTGDLPAYGTISLDEQQHLLTIEKDDPQATGSLASTGFYIFDPAVLEYVPHDRRYQIGRDLLPDLARQGRQVQVHAIGGGYRRIADFRQYWSLNLDLASGCIALPYRTLPAVAHFRSSAVDADATFRGGVLLGAGCRIERDVVIDGPAVIGDHAIIRRGAQLKQVVVMPNTIAGLAATFECAILFGGHEVEVDRQQETVVDEAVLRSNDTGRRADLAEQIFHSLLALVILMLLSPLLLLIAAAIWLESPGPVLYTQLRVGQRRHRAGQTMYPGHVFAFIKFRSMYRNADKRLGDMLDENEYHAETFVKLKRDPRITRVGRLIRKTSIDELPQLINVLKGDMRLVGNRPLPLYEAGKLREGWQQIRFNAPAGMTGLWQVSGRSDLSLEERILLDNYYAISRSFWMDMRIMFLTIPAVLLQRGSR